VKIDEIEFYIGTKLLYSFWALTTVEIRKVDRIAGADFISEFMNAINDFV